MSAIASPSTPNLGGKRVAGQRSEASQRARTNSIRAIKEKWGIEEFIDIFPASNRPEGELGDSAITNLKAITARATLAEARQLMATECVDGSGRPVKMTFKHTTNILASLKAAEAAASPAKSTADGKAGGNTSTSKVPNAKAKVGAKIATPKEEAIGKIASTKTVASKAPKMQEKAVTKPSSLGKPASCDDNLSQTSMPKENIKPSSKNAQVAQKPAFPKPASQAIHPDVGEKAGSGSVPDAKQIGGNKMKDESDLFAERTVIPKKRVNDDAQDMRVKKPKASLSDSGIDSVQKEHQSFGEGKSLATKEAQEATTFGKRSKALHKKLQSNQEEDSLGQQKVANKGSGTSNAAEMTSSTVAKKKVAENKIVRKRDSPPPSPNSDESDLTSPPRHVYVLPPGRIVNDPDRTKEDNLILNSRQHSPATVIPTGDHKQTEENEMRSVPSHLSPTPMDLGTESTAPMTLDDLIANGKAAAEARAARCDDAMATIDDGEGTTVNGFKSARSTGIEGKAKTQSDVESIDVSEKLKMPKEKPVAERGRTYFDYDDEDEDILSQRPDSRIYVPNPLTVIETDLVIKTANLDAKADKATIVGVPAKLNNWISEMSMSILSTSNMQDTIAATGTPLGHAVATKFNSLLRGLNKFGEDLKDLYSENGY